MTGQRQCQRCISAVQYHHELEKTRRPVGALAVVEIAEKVSEKALLALVVLGVELNIYNKVFRLGRILEAVICAWPNSGRRLGARLCREDLPNAGIYPAEEVADAGLNAERFRLVYVIVKGRLDNGCAVFCGCRGDGVCHGGFGVGRVE